MTRTPRRLGYLAFAAALLTLSTSATTALAAVPKTGMICTLGTLSGSTRTFNLVAKTGHVQTPDGNSLLMWSYATGATPASSPFQLPGPVLCANQGETVNVVLTDNLTIKNGGGDTDPVNTSIVFPGQQGVTATGGSPGGLLTTEATNGGGSVTYSFTAGQPGTYLYESGTDVSMQVEMGLYGALIIRPTGTGFGPNYAYNHGSTQFNGSREYLLLLSDIDPDLHHAVETGGTYDFTTKHDRYFMINGRDFPDTVQDNGSPLLPDQPYGALVRLEPNSASNPYPALLRMINVGTDPHPFHPHGNHTRQIAQDGRLLLSPSGSPATTEHFGETIGSGETRDYLLRWDDVDNWNPTTNPLPVAQPNYRNLTFKDATTWYSGNPYLGYKGTLPTGTNQLNICGEWYFPLHSHALNEFSNFNEGFGGMGTLLRVDPPNGCFTSASATTLVGGKLKSGSPSALGLDDSTYYQVNPSTTTKTGTTGLTAAATTITVASNTGFPAPTLAQPYYVRADNEVIQVTGRSGTGNLTWTVVRGQLGTAAATHAANVTLTALATDWYASFSGVVAGAANLTVTYKGKNCSNTATAVPPCTALTTNLPLQTVKICDWTVGGAAGCSTATSAGWVTLPAPQNQAVGSTDLSTTWLAAAPFSKYVGTGTNRGQVRVLVHTQRWTAPSPTPFSTWGNLFKLVYTAP